MLSEHKALVAFFSPLALLAFLWVFSLSSQLTPSYSRLFPSPMLLCPPSFLSGLGNDWNYWFSPAELHLGWLTSLRAGPQHSLLVSSAQHQGQLVLQNLLESHQWRPKPQLVMEVGSQPSCCYWILGNSASLKISPFNFLDCEGDWLSKFQIPNPPNQHSELSWEVYLGSLLHIARLSWNLKNEDIAVSYVISIIVGEILTGLIIQSILYYYVFWVSLLALIYFPEILRSPSHVPEYCVTFCGRIQYCRNNLIDEV